MCLLEWKISGIVKSLKSIVSGVCQVCQCCLTARHGTRSKQRAPTFFFYAPKESGPAPKNLKNGAGPIFLGLAPILSEKYTGTSTKKDPRQSKIDND